MAVLDLPRELRGSSPEATTTKINDRGTSKMRRERLINYVARLHSTRPTCTKYDDYVPPAPPPESQRYALGERVPIKVVHDQRQLRVFMRDVVIARASIDGPLTGFRFDAYATAEEQWHLTVDAVRVYR